MSTPSESMSARRSSGVHLARGGRGCGRPPTRATSAPLALVSTQAGLALWLDEVEFELKVGAPVRFVLRDAEAHGEVLAIDAPQHVSWSWDWTGEPLGAPGKNFAQPPLNSALVPDSAGFLYVDRPKFHDAFCKDLPEAEASIMAVTQKPLSGSVFEASVPTAAWKTVPSWFVVSSQDHAINPDLERFYAKRMGATTSEIASSQDFTRRVPVGRASPLPKWLRNRSLGQRPKSLRNQARRVGTKRP